jgi:ADP-ribose pyrophosphatase YjhB (NUDIX family)
MTLTKVRRTARLIVVDQLGAVLLVRYEEHFAGAPATYWVPPGGGIEAGEGPRDAAARELREETSLDAEIGREFWTCESEFQTSTGAVRQIETFYWVELTSSTPRVLNSTPEPILEQRWWRLDDLLATQETIYPAGLRERLREAFGKV